ncbi:D-2-hydroxyacid dehydrogenase family protein [Marinomonas ostreistagni]|uniref:D-2-hydroxyacid dehydrogenase family protein n=1 Tax=Marinomonas ostreistagni TaxID=359209 RepID=A0ABS0ZF14_9GAMM|nr:D-2-hydroxyacid dehydrogenase family protein [Marinomonas ostreistagni]MBJ7552256.1 D-2-hydroxyacid dehydrogenase family protein [Marinomonas ostreistagni]
MKISILDDYQNVVRDLNCFALLDGHEVEVLQQTYTESELIEKLSNTEALVLIRERTLITESLLQKLPNLKVISQTGKVSHHIDVDVCKRYGVEVLEGVGSPVAPSELTWALIMSAIRHIPSYSSNLKGHIWQSSGNLGLGRSLKGLTLGIWGYGKIGKRIASYAKAFEMDVLIWGREASRDQAVLDGFSAASSKADFFSRADIISLHLRLNEDTKHCVTAEDLSHMKENALFVNTSRAELVEHNALFSALQHCPTRQAAIDVFDNEPALLDPLLSLENVTATPHIGYVEKNSYELYFGKAFENLLNWCQ